MHGLLFPLKSCTWVLIIEDEFITWTRQKGKGIGVKQACQAERKAHSEAWWSTVYMLHILLASSSVHPALCPGAGLFGMCLQGSLTFRLLNELSQWATSGGEWREMRDKVQIIIPPAPSLQGLLSLGWPFSLWVLGTAPSPCPFRPRDGNDLPFLFPLTLSTPF